MKWVEVIQLRSTARHEGRLRSELRQLMEGVEMETSPQEIKVYHRELIDTDYCIELRHDSDRLNRNGSRLGIHLVSALKAFGLVNHSVWVEMQPPPPSN